MIYGYIMRIKNNINLYLGLFNWLVKDNTDYNVSLSHNYNSFEENTKTLML
jgi:hypothetical protein